MQDGQLLLAHLNCEVYRGATLVIELDNDEETQMYRRRSIRDLQFHGHFGVSEEARMPVDTRDSRNIYLVYEDG